MKSSEQYVALAEEALRGSSSHHRYAEFGEHAIAQAQVGAAYIELAKMALKIENEE